MDVVAILLSGSGLSTLISGFMEGSGIPWPGAVVMAAVGAEHNTLLGAAVLATLFAVMYTIGSLAQYALGRYCRGALERFLSAKMRQRLEHAIRKYGQAAVLWTRPLAVGNYISIPAGMMGMNPTKFALFTFAGIWPWAFGMAAFGSLMSRWLSYATAALPFVAAIMATYAVFSVVRKLWRRTHPRQEAASYGD